MASICASALSRLLTPSSARVGAFWFGGKVTLAELAQRTGMENPAHCSAPRQRFALSRNSEPGFNDVRVAYTEFLFLSFLQRQYDIGKSRCQEGVKCLPVTTIENQQRLRLAVPAKAPYSIFPIGSLILRSMRT